MKKLFYVTMVTLIGCLVVIFMQHLQIKKLTSPSPEETVQKVTVQEETVEKVTQLPISQLTPYVISNSDYSFQGSKYSAKVVLAVEDSTFHPEFFVEGKRIGDDGIYETQANGYGTKKYSGNVVYRNPVTGEAENKSFHAQYSVILPMVNITNVDLNVMYSNHDNKYSISVPGVPGDKVQVKAEDASVKRQQGLWIINPNDNVKAVTVSVLAEINGKMQTMGVYKYRVENNQN